MHWPTAPIKTWVWTTRSIPQCWHRHRRVTTSSAIALRVVPGLVRTDGFTLVELLVAITILAAVAVMGWRGLDVLIRARDSLTTQLEDARRIQITFAQLEADCADLVNPAMLPGRAPIVITPDSLLLVRFVRAEGEPSKLKVVAYHLVGGVLVRRESVATRDLDAVDAAWIAASSQDPYVHDVQLQRNVTSMQIRIWQGAGRGWRTPGIDVVSADSANPASASGFPSGLEISLRLARSQGAMTKVFLIGVP
ncbi:MAG: prepilin-type N-terminal cleavage/methylation domain-containing protein [Thermoleophilia bacterium]|nr:prepilin-type N-terminal cleavage/methylation domain-containing protein [Thermoleophilia bacterium]